MISSIANNPGPMYAAQNVSSAKTEFALKSISSQTDLYERADGTVATRQDLVHPEDSSKNNSENADGKKFRELLHKVVGQVLFGQMLKGMRATQEKNPYFDGGRAEEIFQGELDNIFVEKMTQATSKTMSDPMYRIITAPKVQ